MTMEIESGTGLAELMPVLKNGKWVKKCGEESDEKRKRKRRKPTKIEAR